MPHVRPRAQMRSGRNAWSRLQVRLDRAGASSDGGFTMVEMIVALVIIGIIMSALGTFFVSTVSATAQQGSKQAAVQITDDAVELVRALKGSAVISGRDPSSSDTQWNAPVVGVAAYQADMIEASDSSAVGTGATATLPTVGKTVTINGLVYTKNWYVGSCWQPTGGGACGKTTGTVAFYRVVVAVTWSDKVCATGTCSYIATTLVSNATTEPLFNSNLIAQAPKVVNPGTQTSDQNAAISPLTVTSTGGAGTVTWTYAGLPNGLSGTAAGVISGSPSTTGTYSVTISATDGFALTGTAVFSWKVVLPPSVNGVDQVDVANTLASYTASVSGGNGVITWSASGLPAGITMNTSSGLMSGTATAAAAPTVTVTATDGQGQAASDTFKWTIAGVLTLTTPATQAAVANVAITAVPVAYSGGIATYSWSATGLPAGMSINSAGQISGTPTVAGAYSVTVTVSDGSSQSATTSAFTWNVLGIVSPPNNVASARGSAITAIDPAAIGGTGNYTWSTTAGSGVNQLPPGLTIVAATGVIAGTPTTASNATYTFTLNVKDNTSGVTASMAVTWLVTNALIVATPNANQFSVAGTAITAITPTTLGGSGTPTAWAITGLPTGLTYSTTTGKIQGTPAASTAGNTYAVTITVTRGTGGTATSDSQVISWTVYANALTITSPASNRTGTKNVAIASFTGTATGGSGFATWSATGLPTGVTVNSAGTFSGTPSAKGTFSTVVTATDATGAIATSSFSWTVS